MTVRDVAEALGLEVLAGEDLDREVRGGYAADLLSDVMAHAGAGSLWVTLQTHANVAAVASLKELAGVVIANGRRPEADLVARAREHKVNLLASPLPSFEIAGRLYGMGIRGSQ